MIEYSTDVLLRNNGLGDGGQSQERFPVVLQGRREREDHVIS